MHHINIPVFQKFPGIKYHIKKIYISFISVHMQTKVIECCETQAFVKVQSVFQALFVVFVVQRRPQELKTDELQDLFKLNKLYVWDRKEEVYSNMNAEVQAKSFSTSATQINSP